MAEYLRDARVYLSGAIEFDNSNLNWRISPMKELSDRFGLNVFDPFSDPMQIGVPEASKKAKKEKNIPELVRIAKGIVRKDLSRVDRSDILIAYLPPGIPTCGTHHEIINSNNAKKPTLLVTKDGIENIPLWYFGFIPAEFMFPSWDHLYNYLQEVHDGKHMENNRWSFIYGLI